MKIIKTKITKDSEVQAQINFEIENGYSVCSINDKPGLKLELELVSKYPSETKAIYMKQSSAVEINSISVFEKDNGFEIEATANGETYKVYAQLPDCPDSEHSFLDDNDDEEILNQIIGAAREEHGNMDYAVYLKLGAIVDYKEAEHNDYYVIVDGQDVDNFFFAKKSRYSDYYNTFIFDDLDEYDHEDEVLMGRLIEMKRELCV